MDESKLLMKLDYLLILFRLSLLFLPLKSLVNLFVHECHRTFLVPQDFLNGRRVRRAFWPHENNNVGAKAFAFRYLLANLVGYLCRHLVAAGGTLVMSPEIRRAEEVLRLDIDKMLGLSDMVYQRLMSRSVH